MVCKGRIEVSESGKKNLRFAPTAWSHVIPPGLSWGLIQSQSGMREPAGRGEKEIL